MKPEADPAADQPSANVPALALASRIDTTTTHSARRYGYWLGGKDHFAADRESGDTIAAAFPHIRTAVRENRRFLHRAVTYLAGEVGIAQFLDIGTGIPTADNTHEVAQRITPTCRVVYADNDPIVLAHARALLTSTPAGATAYLDADLRDPDQILNHPDLAHTLDLGKPVALMLIAILHFLTDADDPYRIVAHLVDAMPPGSYLTVSHTTYDFMPADTIAALDAATAHERFQARTREQVARFFDGLDLVEPGIVTTTQWRPVPQPEPQPTPMEAAAYAALARIP
ncbi:SAM-dependent methyltransferase [Rugosimonospora africana]|nr:SAM-dependent methyltransferase [Rugosimonospora africana]